MAFSLALYVIDVTATPMGNDKLICRGPGTLPLLRRMLTLQIQLNSPNDKARWLAIRQHSCKPFNREGPQGASMAPNDRVATQMTPLFAPTGN